jgi:hypothetical protein
MYFVYGNHLIVQYLGNGYRDLVTAARSAVYNLMHHRPVDPAPTADAGCDRKITSGV